MSKGKFLITDTSNVNQLPGDPLLLLPQGSLLWAVPLAVSWGAAIFPLRTLSITHLSAFFFFFFNIYFPDILLLFTDTKLSETLQVSSGVLAV